MPLLFYRPQFMSGKVKIEDKGPLFREEVTLDEDTGKPNGVQRVPVLDKKGKQEIGPIFQLLEFKHQSRPELTKMVDRKNPETGKLVYEEKDGKKTDHVIQDPVTTPAGPEKPLKFFDEKHILKKYPLWFRKA